MNHEGFSATLHNGLISVNIRLSIAWQDDPPPELLERDRLPQNKVGLPLS